MATETVSTPGIAEGTTVGAYPASRWREDQLPPSGAPLGAATNTQTVASQKVTFTGLTAGVSYFATDAGGSRYYRFTVDADTPGGTVQPGLNTVGPAELQDDAVFKSGTHATRIAAAHTAGQLWKETDTGLIYFDNGSTWDIWKDSALLYKAADQTLTQSNVTPQNITGLSWPVEAGEAWFVEANLDLSAASATPDVRVTFAGAAIKADLQRVSPAVGTSPTALSTTTLATGGDALEWLARAFFFLAVSAQGTAQFQASQNTSDPTNVVVKAGTNLVIRRAA